MSALSEKEALGLIEKQVGPLTSEELDLLAPDWYLYFSAPTLEDVDDVVRLVLAHRIEQTPGDVSPPLTTGQLRAQLLLRKRQHLADRVREWRVKRFGCADPPFASREEADEWIISQWETEPRADEDDPEHQYTIFRAGCALPLHPAGLLHELPRLCNDVAEGLQANSYDVEGYILTGVLPKSSQLAVSSVHSIDPLESEIRITVRGPLVSAKNVAAAYSAARADVYGVQRTSPLDRTARLLLAHWLQNDGLPISLQWATWNRKHPQTTISFDNYRKALARAKDRLHGKDALRLRTPSDGDLSAVLGEEEYAEIKQMLEELESDA